MGMESLFGRMEASTEEITKMDLDRVTGSFIILRVRPFAEGYGVTVFYKGRGSTWSLEGREIVWSGSTER